MGTLARTRGDAEMAVRYYADAMEIFRELDAWPEIARCQAGIGWIAVTSGDYDQAQESLGEALRLNQVGGERLGIARGLEAFAALAAARQQPQRAARLAGAACQLRESPRARGRHRPADRGGARVRPRPARRLGRGRPVRRGPRDGRARTPSASRSAATSMGPLSDLPPRCTRTRAALLVDLRR